MRGEDLSKHSSKKSIFLHLIPSFPVLIGYIFLGPIAEAEGYPSFVANLIVLGTSYLIFELGYMLGRYAEHRDWLKVA
jgi:hypothetical protein